MYREKNRISLKPRVLGQAACGILIAWCLAVFGWSTAYGDQAFYGNEFVFGGGSIYLTGQSHFISGIVGTDRNPPIGLVRFADGATWTGASDSSHVDGYVERNGSSAFTFPIGDNGVYRPAAIGGAANTTAAYYQADPNSAVTSNLAGGNYSPLPSGAPFSTNSRGTDVAAVSTVEYWHITGATSTKITLTWNAASAIGSLTNSTLTDLTIVAWNGSQWVKVASAVDATSLDTTSSTGAFTGPPSTLTSGSITTTSALPPNTYTVYTLGALHQPPSLAKTFITTPVTSPATIIAGGKADLTFTLTNSAGASAKSGVGFTDTLPANIVVAPDPNGVSHNNCGTPTISAPGAGHVITVANASVASGATCTIKVKVTASTVSPTTGACTDPAWADWRNDSASISAINSLVNNVTPQCLSVGAGAVTICGTVFTDNGLGSGSGALAHNGIRDGGELAAGQVTVVLSNASGTVATTETLANGSYTLVPGAASGPFTLRVIPATGWVNISESVGTSGGTVGDTSDGKITAIPAPTTNVTGVDFGLTGVPSFLPDNTQQAPAGTFALAAHTFQAATTGTVSFAVTGAQALPNIAGWHAQLLRDVNCNGKTDAGDDPITGPIAMSADNATDPDKVCVLARVIIPPGDADGSQYSMQVEATFTWLGQTFRAPTPFKVNDLILVGANSGLLLLKSADKATAAPGDEITYTLTYRNNQTAGITDIVLNDATPDYTTYVGGSAVCVTTPLPAALTGCTVTAQPAAGTSGSFKWLLSGTLSPGSEGEVEYKVKIDQ